MFCMTIANTFLLWFWMLRMSPVLASSPGNGASCWGGPASAAGNFSCEEPEPYLLLGIANGIKRMNLDGGEMKRIVSRVGRSILLDFHIREGILFWADTQTGTINRAGLNGTGKQRLRSSVKGISGLSIDWIGNALLWSNADKGTIQRMGTDGNNGKMLMRRLPHPRSVVVDPNERYIFWLSQGTSTSIQRSDLTGERIRTLLKVVDELKALTVDHRDSRLFWVQQGLEGQTAMGSCNYDGNIINVFNQHFNSPFLRMTVFLDYIYLTDVKSRGIIRLNKYTGGLGENVNSKRMLDTPADVRVVHPINQPVADVPFSAGCSRHTGECERVCSSPSDSGPCRCKNGFTLSKHGNYCEDINECSLWNHGCSLGCENVPGSYFCTCPRGYLLLPDLKTCHENKPCVENATVCDYACVHTADGDACVCPEGSLLTPDGHSCTGCLSLDRGGCSQKCATLFPGSWVCECQSGYQLLPDGKHCAASGPPAYLLFANTVDIREINADGTWSRKLLEDPRGDIIALDYDPVNKRVYFADKGRHHIESSSLDGGSRELLFSTGLHSPEALAVDWVHRKLYWTDSGLSCISRSTLNGREREIFVDQGLQKPRGIAVHPQTRKVFWTDTGSSPVVECSALDRRTRVVVVSNGLVAPSGLCVDHGSQRLYWTDLSRGVIESANLDGSQRQIISQNQVDHPFDIAVFENVLWVSDRDGQLLYRLDRRPGHSQEHQLFDSFQPAALVVVHPLSKPEQENCVSLTCDVNAECVLLQGRAVCQCARGFTAEGEFCVDVDECSTGVADCSVQEAECVNTAGGFFCQCKHGFTGDGHHCKDIDECSEFHNCDVNAACLNAMGSYHCLCRSGFTGTGFSCQEEFDGASSRPSTGTPHDVTSPGQHSKDIQSCPSTYDSYCLYDGVCFYFPEMESYACNCVLGYMGERCQFSDLEWWELQQAEEGERRNMLISVGVVLLVSSLSLAACLSYCCGSKRHLNVCASDDYVGEITVSEYSFTGSTTAPPKVYVGLDSSICSPEKLLHIDCSCSTPCPSSCTERRGVSFSSEEAQNLQTDLCGLALHNCSESCKIPEKLLTEDTPENLITLEDAKPAPQ